MVYPPRENGRQSPPDYSRVARALRTIDLEDEVLAGLGTPEYQEAVQSELARRRKEGT